LIGSLKVSGTAPEERRRRLFVEEPAFRPAVLREITWASAPVEDDHRA
jgi:hypothetical protein